MKKATAIMKKFVILTALLLTTATLTTDAMGHPFGRRGGHHRDPKPIDHNGKKPVGAPLDGGLLLLLGSAGVAYYAAKKQKVRDQE